MELAKGYWYCYLPGCPVVDGGHEQLGVDRRHGAIVGQIALEWGVNPMLLVIPVTIASNCAFMLPMATPPNAIIFGSQRIAIREMASVGLVLNVIAAFS